MATPNQRVKAIFDALLNADVPNAKIVVGVNALLSGRGPAMSEEVLTTTQKSEAVLDMLLSQFKAAIRYSKAQVGVIAANNTATTETETDFTPTP